MLSAALAPLRAFRAGTLLALMLCVLSACLSGCHVQLIMPYDPVLDQSFTALQQSTEQLFGQLEADPGSPATSYENHKDFYIKAHATLRTMRTRARFEPQSAEVLTQIDALDRSLAGLQQLHINASPNGPNAAVIHAAEGPIESQFASIFQLQLALKSRMKRPISANATAPALTN